MTADLMQRISGIEHIPKISGSWIAAGVWLIFCFILGEIDNWRMDRKQFSKSSSLEPEALAAPDGSLIEWSIAQGVLLFRGRERKSPLTEVQQKLDQLACEMHRSISRANRSRGLHIRLTGVEVDTFWATALYRQGFLSEEDWRGSFSGESSTQIKGLRFGNKELVLHITDPNPYLLSPVRFRIEGHPNGKTVINNAQSLDPTRSFVRTRAALA